MSPAAPALIQAARAHQQAGHLDHAATLALRLTLEHPDDPNALQFGQTLLNQLAGKFVRVEVSCDGCTLDVDGNLQESQSFFVEPDVTHKVTASFETGERKADVSGQAGQTQNLEFEAPPAPPELPVNPDGTTGSMNGALDQTAKPLKPVFTFVGAGITAALLAGSIISTIDMNQGVDPYKESAARFQACAKKAGADCTDELATAQKKLDDGQKKETRTTVLWVATGAFAAATGAIALFLTDWSGRKKEHAQGRPLQLAAVPTVGGAALFMKGSF
jgi:hypothetical protein